MERKIIKAGYLIKSPPQEKLMAQWHRRYFILWSSKLMEYYTSHERKPHEYLKTINLSKCEDMVAPLPMTNRLYVIKLSVRKDVKQCRDYFFDCSSEEEMISWVKCLAQVCGFSPTNEKNDDENDPYASTTIYQRCGQNQTGINDNTANNSSQHTPTRPKLRSPLSPAHLSPAHLSPARSFSQEAILNLTYEEPMGSKRHTCHLLEDDRSPDHNNILERRHSFGEVCYDDVGINDAVLYSMNKHPPPVWHPQDETRQKPPPLPPGRGRLSDPGMTGKSSLSVDSSKNQRISSSSPKHNRPLPPPKPRHQISSPKGLGLDLLKNDPKFKRKLEEKRQEVYGETVFRSVSEDYSVDSESVLSPDNTMDDEFYESVLYTVDEPVDYETQASVPKLPPKTDSMKKEEANWKSPIPNRCQTPPKMGSDKFQTMVSPTKGSPIHQRLEENLPVSRRRLASTPTSPPPLPSREVICPDPPHSSLLTRKLPIADDEIPPPVPVRQFRDHSPVKLRQVLPIHPNSMAQLQEERRKSLPSPHEWSVSLATNNRRPRRPLPTPPSNFRASAAGLENRSLQEHVLSSALRMQREENLLTLPPKPHLEPDTDSSMEVYEDIKYNSEESRDSPTMEVYEDIKYNSEESCDSPTMESPMVPDHQHPVLPAKPRNKLPTMESPMVPDHQHPVLPKPRNKPPTMESPMVPDHQHPVLPAKPRNKLPTMESPMIPDHQHPVLPAKPRNKPPTMESPMVPDHQHPVLPAKPLVTRNKPSIARKPMLAKKPPPPTPPKPAKGDPENQFKGTPSFKPIASPRQKRKPAIPKKPVALRS